MRAILLAGFAGSNLTADPRQLPETVGTYALDLEPGRDRFIPLKARVTRATVPASPQRKSIYRMGRDVVDATLYWLSDSLEVSYARMFGENTTERTIITGNGTPKWTNTTLALSSTPYPQAVRELAVPIPAAPTVTLVTDGAEGTSAFRYYVQTFVNDLGWESAPSPPSLALSCKTGAIVDLTLLGAAPAGNYGLTGRRIYVTQPGTGDDTEFYFLREIALATTTTQDDARQRGGLLATYDGTVGSSWLPPPTAGFGVIALWAGMHAMLSGDGGKLHICEPSAPYAWPAKYDRPLKAKGVALGKWGQNLVVLTTAEPVVYQGVDPLGMAPLPPGLNHPIRSARGAVSFANGVAYPSNDGLAWIGEAGQAILTDGVLTPEQWRAMNPSTMIAGRWRDCYVCAFNDGTSRGFMFDLKNPGRIWWLSSGFDACHYDELSQALFVLEGGNVREFAAGAAMTGSFTGKRFLQTPPTNYGFAKVTATQFPVTLKVTSYWQDPIDGTQRTNVETRTVTGPGAFTLQGGFQAEEIVPEVSGSSECTVVRLAREARDLRGV